MSILEQQQRGTTNMSTEEFFDIDLSKSQRAILSRTKERIVRVGTALRQDKLAMTGLIILTLFVLLAVFAPYIAPYGPGETVTLDGEFQRLSSPSSELLFGTNHLSQDLFSQWVYGSRVSLVVGLLAGSVVGIVGTSVGITAGYFGGRVDNVLMRFVDILYGFPATPLILVLALFFEPSLWNILIAFTLVLWRTMARVIRSQTLTIRERPYVKAARSTGASHRRIMAFHILPNLLPLILIEVMFITAFAIALEAGVSFLGFGVQTVSWGTMLQSGFSNGAMREAWWWILPPGLSITLVIVALFYVARAMESITNPENKRFE
jgi:peptide/nickel transport system permease protein